MADGTRTSDLPTLGALDEVIGNGADSTGRMAVDNFAQQLVGAGPVAAEFDTVRSQILSGVIPVATWAELSARAVVTDGEGAEVPETDTGTHADATATGYDGATVPNSGRYRGDATWNRWVRVGDVGLASKAPIDSPVFTGTPQAPSPISADNSTRIATTAFVQAVVNGLINAAPGSLDTLNELAAALGDDPNFAATVTAQVAAKADLDSPAFTGTPQAPTASSGDSSTRLATTAFVAGAVAGLNFASAAQGAKADTAVQPGADNAPAHGFIPVLNDPAGSPWLSWDVARQMLRHPGDALDAARAPVGMVWAALAGGQAALTVGVDGAVCAPLIGDDAPVAVSKAYDDGAGAVAQVAMADGSQFRRLTFSPVACHPDPRPAAPGLIRVAREDGRIGHVRASLGVPALPDNLATLDIAMGVSMSQSNGLGSVSFDPGAAIVQPNAVSPLALMFNGGVLSGVGMSAYDANDYLSLVPAFDALAAGDTIGHTGAPIMAALLAAEMGKRVLVNVCGNGGTAWEDLEKGTQPWTNMIYGIQRGKALADAAGVGFDIAFFSVIHGETHGTDSEAQYRQRQVDSYADFKSDAGAITGTTITAPWVSGQIGLMEPNTGTGLAAFKLDDPGGALMDLVLNPVPGMLVTGPNYVARFGDNFHRMAEWHIALASRRAEVIRKYRQRGFWQPLHMTSARSYGTKIEVTFDGGTLRDGGHVMIDRKLVSDPGQAGFVFADSAMSAQVIEVAVTDRNKITLTLNAKPTGSAPEVGLAFFGATDNDNQGNDTGLRSCVRDTERLCCPVTLLPLPNFAMHQKIGVS